ncbi:MAG: hypothetical protein AAB475_00760 [Patescibacteria group bacterium]
MEEIYENQKKSIHKESKIILTIIAVIIVIAAFFIYIYSNDINLLDRASDKKIFSEDEKLEILNNLSGNPDKIPSIEERKEILNNISKNKPADAYEYSGEGKLQILRELQRQ